jgi:DNA polymerase-3 subunit epsilon
MSLKLNRPIVFFDLESTGLNPQLDRIVEFAFIKRFPDGHDEKWVERLNPERPMPQEVIDIHGITDADVAKCRRFSDIALELMRFLAGCDLAGFAITQLDIPLLSAEFQRANLTFETGNIGVVDSQRIFHVYEPRNLSAAVKFYCGEELEGAHGAEADAIASMKVMEGEFARYADLPTTVEELDKISRPHRANALDPDGRLRWRGAEVYVAFGQKRGMTLRELVATDKQFLNWILNKNFTTEVKTIVRDALNGKFPQRLPEQDD